jgi:hypothetical protein
MMWEQFEGVLGSNGTPSLRFEQTIPSLPAIPLRQLVSISYNTEQKLGVLLLDPDSDTPISFLLDISGSGKDVKMGDSVVIYGGSITWIEERL